MARVFKASEFDAEPPRTFKDSDFDSNQPGGTGGIVDYLTTKDLSNAPKYDVLAQGARLGQFANKGNQDLAGIIAEKGGQYEASRSARAGDNTDINVPQFLGGGTIQYGAIPSVLAAGTLGTASEFLLPQTRLGVASYLVQPAMQAYQALNKSTGIQKPGIVAQLGQARTKVPAGDIQQAINDPSIFQAPSVQDAGKAYQSSLGEVKNATQSLSNKLNKTILSEGDYTDAINRAGRILSGTETATNAAGELVPVEMDPQTALESVQSINRFIRNKSFTSKLDKGQMGEILNLKSDLMAYMENNGLPGVREAATNFRKASINENLSKILPQNKFGGNDALRTMGSGAELATAAGFALTGNPLMALPLAADALTSSPAVLGGAIRNYQSLSNPSVMGAAGAAVNAQSNIANEYNKKRYVVR